MCVFLSQQIAEKYLKGLLLFDGNELVKTHDLVELMNLLKKSFPKVEKFAKDLLVLTNLYFESRYPGGFTEQFNWDDAHEAFEIAKNVKNFALKSIGL
jgi:HEPN domain-containing protein